jgi:cytochrome b
MPAHRRVLVWDAVVRAVHWLVAGTVLFDFVHDDGDRLHRIVGYVGAAAIVLRLLWAAVARGHGRLAVLKPSWSATRRYLHQHAPRQPGHDPLGLWMVWLLWLLVLLLAATGWVSRLDAFWGDERVQVLHEWLADALLVAVVLHLFGVTAMSLHWRENLPLAMLTGRKRPPDPGEERTGMPIPPT